MSSTQVVRVRNGETITVRSGVLRGAGPQGPMGPVGPKGDKGDAGATGPAGEVNDVRTDLSTSAPVAIGGNAQWYDIGILPTTQNDVLVDTTDPYGLQFKETGLYGLLLLVRFEQQTGTPDAGTSSGSRKLRFVDQQLNILNNAQVSYAAAPTEPTIVPLIAFVDPDPSKKYKLQALADDITGISVTDRFGKVLRIGSGPQGVPGPQGPVGQQGPQGPQGANGSAGSGYTSYDALIGGTDSTADPGGVYGATADQAIPIPTGAQKPSSPWFLKNALTWLERRIMAKYTSATDRNTRRATRQVAELTYLDDTGSVQFREKNGNDNNLARVVTSSSTPPSGAGAAAPGVIWAQY